MRKAFIFITLLVYWVGAFAQTAHVVGPPSSPSMTSIILYPVNVSSLPAASTNTNSIRVVRDGQTASDCTVGGGTTRSLCISNGSAWVALGGGGGQIAGVASDGDNGLTVTKKVAAGTSVQGGTASAGVLAALPAGSHGFACDETATAGVPAAGVDYLRCDSATHTIRMSLNGAAETALGSGSGTGDTWVVSAPTPVFNPATGTYSGTQSVTASCASGTAYCSSDGSSLVSCTDISVAASGTLYARCEEAGKKPVNATAAYTITGASSDPSTITNLAAWYKADSLSLNDNDAVTSWTDSSGNSHTATKSTCANAPVYKVNQLNSKPALSFNGASTQCLDIGTPPTLTAATIFIVFNPTYNTTNGVLGGNASGSLLYRIHGSPSHSALVNYGTAVIGDSTSAVSIAGWNFDMASWNNSGGAWAFKHNKSASGSGTTSTTISASTRYIGFESGNNYYMTGYIAEIIIYSRVLNSTEIGTIETYIAGKYGL